MNTNNLKRFAQQTRRKLLEQVAAKMEQVLHTDSAELREKAGALRKLQEAINATSKEQVIDKVAYTWFNRLMALRFMDANDYQPIGLRVVTPKPGYTIPELLDEAEIPALAPGAMAHSKPFAAAPNHQESLGFPGQLVEDWHDRAIADRKSVV